jgi:hypothetical protein
VCLHPISWLLSKELKVGLSYLAIHPWM